MSEAGTLTTDVFLVQSDSSSQFTFDTRQPTGRQVLRQSWARIGFIHGFDLIGLGRFVGGIAWIGLDWVRWPLIASKVKFSETQSWTGQTNFDCILAFSVCVAFSDF